MYKHNMFGMKGILWAGDARSIRLFWSIRGPRNSTCNSKRHAGIKRKVRYHTLTNIITPLTLYLILLSECASLEAICTMLQEHRSQELRDIDGNQRINVCRNFLFDDCVTAFSRHTFNPRLNLKVRFIGEPAVDAGGPKWELFRLFFI